jgi:hypothetical protein
MNPARLRPPARHGLSRRQTMSLLAALGVGADALAAGPADATRAAPHSYRVLLENDRVRVLEYRSRPGTGVCGDGVHSHPDHVTISIRPAKLRVAVPGGKPQVAEVPAGFVLWEDAGTHVAENIGGLNAHLVIVEMKGRDWAPSTG